MARRGIRLLMTVDAVGGIWTYATDLAGAFTGLGADVTLAVIGPGLDAAKRQVAADGGFALVDIGHSPEWLADGPDAVARGGAALASLAGDMQADLVHLNHPALGAGIAFACPVLAVCHSCVATWWAAVRGSVLPRDMAWQADLVGAAYRQATALAAPSRAFALATRQAYGLERTPQVVFNGRATAPASGGDPDIAGGLTVGRLWDEAKDVATLDRAAALARYPIRAVGPTSGPNGASVALHRLDAAGPAGDAEVRRRLARRPVYLSAARYEPFGLSVLEAAQAGCSLVLSDIPTFRELWDDAATLVPAGDARAFAQAFDHLIDDPAARDRQGQAALQRAARFTLAGAVERLAALYATMLGRSVVAGMPAGLLADTVGAFAHGGAAA